MRGQPDVLGDQQPWGDPYGFLDADFLNGSESMVMMQDDPLLRAWALAAQIDLLGHDPGYPLLMGDDRTNQCSAVRPRPGRLGFNRR